ncbi:MAG: hypothetical protein AB1502_12040 [Thermodesulfobacteriota bacterium]
MKENTVVEKKPKGFWRRLWGNVEPYKPHGRFKELDRLDEERKRLSDDISCGLVPSDQNFKEHKGLV